MIVNLVYSKLVVLVNHARNTVEKVEKYDNVMFVTISQEIMKEVVVFEDINIYENEKLEIIGEKEGERIIAKKIRVVK